MLKRLFTAASLVALTACTAIEERALNIYAASVEADITAHKDISYGPTARQALDLYVPQGDGPHPVLVFIHGGSWASGSKRMYAFAGKRYAAEGYLTAVINYRLAPDAAYPVFMEDVGAAVAMAYKIAPEYGGDPSQFFVTGHSAGAYNAVMVALAPEFLAPHGLTPDIIDGVVGVSGPYDFLPGDGEAVVAAFGNADPDLADPVERVSANAPPMLLIQGDTDDVVEPRNAGDLERALIAAGAPTPQVVMLEGASHTAPMFAIGRENGLETVSRTVKFFASLEID